MKQIKIIGIGSGCTNALNKMILTKQIKQKFSDKNVIFCTIDSDKKVFDLSQAEEKLLIQNGYDTGGFGADYKKAEEVAFSYEYEINTIIGNPDILIVITTLGGGTGSGITPFVVKLAKEKEIKVIPIVTTPFAFEGRRRLSRATVAIEKINELISDCIIISNEKILEKIDKKMTVNDAFSLVDNEIISKVEEIKYKYGKGFNV